MSTPLDVMLGLPLKLLLSMLLLLATKMATSPDDPSLGRVISPSLSLSSPSLPRSVLVPSLPSLSSAPSHCAMNGAFSQV
jgi:hypothetical protein